MKQLLYMLCLSAPLYAAQASTSHGEYSSDMLKIIEQKREQMQKRLYFNSQKRAHALSNREMELQKQQFTAAYWHKKHADDLSAAMHRDTQLIALSNRVINNINERKTMDMNEIIRWYTKKIAKQNYEIKKTSQQLHSLKTELNRLHTRCFHCLIKRYDPKESCYKHKYNSAIVESKQKKIHLLEEQRDALKEERAFLCRLHMPAQKK